MRVRGRGSVRVEERDGSGEVVGAGEEGEGGGDYGGKKKGGGLVVRWC